MTQPAINSSDLRARLECYAAAFDVPKEQREGLVSQVLATESVPEQALAGLQARLAQHYGAHVDAAAPSYAGRVKAGLAVCIGRSEFPVADPGQALMTQLLPIRRQVMLPVLVERSLIRWVLHRCVYHPLGIILRRLQVLSGRSAAN